MDDVTFRAGVWLLDSQNARDLRNLLISISDPEVRHTRASVFIREHVDPVELVRTAAAIRAGLLSVEVSEQTLTGPSDQPVHPDSR